MFSNTPSLSQRSPSPNKKTNVNEFDSNSSSAINDNQVHTGQDESKEEFLEPVIEKLQEVTHPTQPDLDDKDAENILETIDKLEINN